MKTAVLSLSLAATLSALVANGQQPRAIRLEDITWPEAERVLRPHTVVVIPIGAAAKEHGPHLKLRNDLILAEYFTGRVAETTDVVIAPTLTYHYYPAFLEYPGSTSLSLETARDLTLDVVRSIARHGPKRFYALNTGISTNRALEPAARELARDGILLRYTDLRERLEPTASKVRQQEGGSHADEIETSLMLHIDPASVDMSRAVRDYRPSAPGQPLTRRPDGPGTFSPSGIWGDPTLATREKGKVLAGALLDGILQDIAETRAADLPIPGPLPPPVTQREPRPTGLSPVEEPACGPGDERAMRQLAIVWTTAWADADANRLAGLWMSDGDVAHPDGAVERGRQVIAQNRAQLFARREYRGSRHPLTVGHVRCVTYDTAVADGKWELRGVTDPSGADRPNIEGLFTMVLRRAQGSWRIEAYRYTITPAKAGPPATRATPGAE